MFQIFLFTMIFLMGLAIGSFLNCVIYRLDTKDSFLKGRSFCPRCRQKLSWPDLIPVFSFLVLKRKCRYCYKKISWQYPLVEIATAVLFVLTVNYELRINNHELLNFNFILNSSFLLLILCFLIIIFVYDLKHFIIPDKVIFPAIAVTFIYNSIFNRLYGSIDLWLYNLGAAFLASAFFLAIFLASRGLWLGFGDVKLVFFLGLFLGWPNILTGLFFSFLFGALIGTVLIILKKKNLKSEVPFAPFLVAGTLLAFFWGGNFINWYIAFIL